MFRKNCALALSMLLMLSSLFPASVYANTVDEGSRSEITVSKAEEKAVEEKQEDAQEKDVSEVETAVEKVAFQEERILDGIRISVTADAGVFPKGSVLKAKKLVKKADKTKVEASIEEKLKDEDATLAESFIFDISIRDKNGEEIQPDTSQGEVKVSFEQLDLSALQEGKELAVFHLDEVEAEAEKLEDVEVKHAEEKVEVIAEHFSVFVVSFIYKDRNTAKSTGAVVGESILLNDLFKHSSPFNAPDLIKSVSSKNEDIVSIMQNPNGQVILNAVQEGEAIITITTKRESIDIKVIVQKPYDQGKLGENMIYVVSGEKGKMLLRIKGYGHSESLDREPWFPYKDQIQKIIIDEGIEWLNVGESLFAEMQNLEEVSLPSTLTYIPNRAFLNSNNLKDVVIPSSVSVIGNYAFLKNGLGRKNTIYNKSSYLLEDEVHYNSEFTTVQQHVQTNTDKEKKENKGKKEEQNKKQNTDRTIDSLSLCVAPGGIKYLERTFTTYDTFDSTEYIDYLYTTKDPNEIVTEDSFKDSYDQFQNPLSNRGELIYYKNHECRGTYYSFAKDDEWEEGETYYCHVLTTKYNKEKDDWLPYKTFNTVIKVGDPKTILPNTEADLTWKVTFESQQPFKYPVYKLSINGTGEIPDSRTNIEMPWNKVFTALQGHQEFCVKLDLSDGITRIGHLAFAEIDKYEGDVILPDSITEIAEESFANTTIDGNIHFPKNLQIIGDRAFQKTKTTGDIILPDKLEYIGEEAFHGNHTRNIVIPNSVISIGSKAFYKYEMGLEGKNTITNYSSIKLSDIHANPLFTNFEREDPAKTNLNPPRRGGGGSGSGGGGGSSSGGGGGSGMKLSTGNGSTSSAPVNWQKDDKGWWVRNNDGSYPKNEWKQVNNNWYFFNGEGYMATGWVAVNDAWYYMEATEGSNSGIMTTGWKLLNDTWYFLSQEAGANSGKMLSGWQLINGKWYYFSTEAGANYGKMLSNTVVDGYALGADGAWNDPAQKNA